MGHEAVVMRDPKAILNASKVVLPGVGAFPDCMRNLEEFGLIDAVVKSIRSGKPFLGICLGLQLLFTESEEFGISKGLDIIKGRVVRFRLGDAALKIPHMGWNGLFIKRRPAALSDIQDGSHFYFVHSFHVVPEDPAVVATTTNYGVDFVSSVWKDNIFATQFHPEKSQALGLSILKRFGEQK
jgi:glutamine amidotransferase